MAGAGSVPWDNPAWEGQAGGAGGAARGWRAAPGTRRRNRAGLRQSFSINTWEWALGGAGHAKIQDWHKKNGCKRLQIKGGRRKWGGTGTG